MAKAPAPISRRRTRKPLELRLTVVVAFGPEDDDRVTVIDDRKVWMVGSIFQYRDRVARLAMATLIRAALMQPKMASKIMPGLASIAQRAAGRASPKSD